MFEIDLAENGCVRMRGRLDAAQAAGAQAFLDEVQAACTIDMAELEYISSAGLGVLLKTHKRLMGGGRGLRLVNVSPHLRAIFRYSGFDKLFQIEAGPE
jgi:anti-sigma B factor antagonist